MWRVPERYRVRRGPLASLVGEDYGAFILPAKIGARVLVCIASPDGGWEHVSIHVEEGRRQKTPTWDEMCYVKSIFWNDEDVVMQLHPAKSEYVNNHPYTLHLWRPTGAEIPTPPAEMVGIKGVEINAEYR